MMTGFYIAQNERIQAGTNNATLSNVQTFIQLRIKRPISFVFFNLLFLLNYYFMIYLCVNLMITIRIRQHD